MLAALVALAPACGSDDDTAEASPTQQVREPAPAPAPLPEAAPTPEPAPPEEPAAPVTEDAEPKPATKAGEEAPTTVEPPPTGSETPDVAGEGGSSLSESDLIGIWVDEQGGDLVRFAEDGTNVAVGVFAQGPEGYLALGGLNSGTYELKGQEMTYTGAAVISVVAGEFCSADEVTVSKVELVAPGTFREVIVSDECLDASGREWVWTKVSSPAGSFFSPVIAEGDRIQATEAAVASVWFRVGGDGELLRLDRGNDLYDGQGTYAIDDSGLLDIDPDEAGTFTILDGTLTLVVENSPVCAERDRLVVQVEYTQPTTLEKLDGVEWGLFGTVVEDTCGRIQEGEEVVWAHILGDLGYRLKNVGEEGRVELG